MLRFVARRLVWGIPVLLVGSLVTFVALRMTTQPVTAARRLRVDPQAIARYRAELGLDRSWLEQYAGYVGRFFRGDLGTSFTTQAPVWPELRTALVNSIVLALVAAVIYMALGVALGVLSAVRQYSWFDHATTGLSFVGLALPPFVFGLICIVAVGTWYQGLSGASQPLLPFVGGVYSPRTQGFDLADRARHLALPVIVLSVQQIAVYSRYMRTGMLETLSADYLRTARAKGLGERKVILQHALRNALIPVVTFAAIDIGALAGGLIVTEEIFGYQGMGKYFLDNYHNADYPALLPWVMIVILFVVAFNIIADITYAWLDPRIRVG
ncbi:MAG: ABC transporter permease [Actinomycetota bacterium]